MAEPVIESELEALRAEYEEKFGKKPHHKKKLDTLKAELGQEVNSDRQYIIRYGLVPANQISNSVIVKNPHYGEPIGAWGSRPVAPSAHEKKRNGEFYVKLRASIEKEGIRNPIFCNSFKEGTFCRYGVSRLWIAKMLKLDVPVIIADYVDRWSHLEELDDDEILDKFLDKPAVLEINDDEMRFDGCPQIHM